MNISTNTSSSKSNTRLLIHAFGDHLPANILCLLSENGEMNVTQIWKKLKIEQSIASQALKLLLKIKIVQKRKEGKYRFYSVNTEIYDKAKNLWDFLGMDFQDLLQQPIPKPAKELVFS